ncbi:MAG: glycoside hydrolase [Acidimicrobiales bacterium]|nr:MAG: glycoside hydrolase [Acidimicrobiales bacterium]
MDLSGVWRAAPATEELRRTFHEPDLDDRAWSPAPVPGHWSTIDELAAARSVLHRTRFELDPVPEGRRLFLCLDGIAQQGDVWLDGGYVGDTDGYFVPHRFEITDLLGDRREHVLGIDVNCSRFGDPDGRTGMMGALQDPELAGAAGENPGGVWGRVHIHETGSVAIRFFRSICLDANPTRARMSMRCVLDAPDGGTVTLRTRVAGHEHEHVHSAAVGENRIEWTFDVPAPALWWPYRLGHQPLHDLRCDVVVDDIVHDHREVRVGFRSIAMKGWTVSVNGERLFLKGAGILPTTPRPGDATAQQVAGDVGAARDAGLDLLRVIAHIARPELYDAADELGVLLWQEMPLRGVMARGVRGQATRQAREAVDLLAHHPSLAVWCVHDEPFRRPTPPTATPPVVGQQPPSWNRDVLDRSIKRVLTRTDGSRPVISHTAVPPHFPSFDGTTSHLWFGWHDGRAGDLAAAAARVPRMARFVTAFGAASVDPGNDLVVDPRWPAIDWEALADAVGAPVGSLHHLVPPTGVEDGSTWATLTQVAQAEVVRTSIELLRRLKYRPTGGFAQFYLADPSPAGGFGVLDHDRRPKPAWQALVDACRPVIVVADPLPAVAHRGEALTVAIHVVSDRREAIEDAVVRATVRSQDGVGETIDEQTQGWGGAIAPDECSRIGDLSFVVPDGTDRIVVDLDLTGTDLSVTNRYSAPVR